MSYHVPYKNLLPSENNPNRMCLAYVDTLTKNKCIFGVSDIFMPSTQASNINIVQTIALVK